MPTKPNKRFLPPPQLDADYPVGSADSFLGNDADFLATLAMTMSNGEPHTSPRRPTPFSPLWQFGSDLEGKSGPVLQKNARRRLRGILSLLALRSREGLVLACKVSPPFDEASLNVPIVDMMRRHISHRSETIFKDKRLIYITLGDQVVAGYSPETLFFPASKHLVFPTAIRPTWFSEELGEWLDPTDGSFQLDGSEVKLDPTSIPGNAGAIRVWLDDVLAWMRQGGPGINNVLPDHNLLLKELSDWRVELNQFAPVGQVSPNAVSIQGDATPSVIAFLGSIAPLASTVAANGNSISDLTCHRGRYLLTKLDLREPTRRLIHRTYGNATYELLWKDAPVSGEHLGAALGLPAGEREALAIPFVFVDKLFTPALSRLSDSGFVPNRPWRALTLGKEVFAYPLAIRALEFFSLGEIESALSIRKTQLDDGYYVSFTYELFVYEKTFEVGANSSCPVETLDPSLDFRLFPDYDLCSLKKPDIQIPAPEDRCYYARIRLGKTLSAIENAIIPIFEGEDGVAHAPPDKYERKAIGSLERLSNELYGSGRRLVMTVRPEGSRLGGFDFGGKGLIALCLDKAVEPQGDLPQSATIGIDFGTSNTCLSTLAGNDDPIILAPKSATTSFLSSFAPNQRDGSHEGYAADLDFFPTSSSEATRLYNGSFFPTQLASRLQFQPGDFREVSGFDPLRALICFESVSDFLRKDTAKRKTLAKYGVEGEKPEFEPPIHLKDHLKWDAENSDDPSFIRSLRLIFLHHLRLQLVHSTAKNGAFIANIRASYPRAFTTTQRDIYRELLESVWARTTASFKPDVKIFTESHAAAAFLKTQEKVDHFLIDIGGGTTDICIFSDGRMTMESSVRMAADVIDRFFLHKESQTLRDSFFQAYENRLSDNGDKEVKNELKRLFAKAATNDADFDDAVVPRALFYALLGLAKALPATGRALIYNSLSDSSVFKAPPVQRFYTTLAVFYGGLAYFSGLMLRKKVQSGQMDGRKVQISFAGNGANHLLWLRLENETPLDLFLAKMFRAGSGLPDQIEVSVDILHDAKASVALGLVRNNVGANQVNTNDSIVYDLVEGTWESAAAKTLVDLYNSPDPSNGWDFEKSEVRSFLDALAKAAPNGKIGKRSATLLTTPDWTSSLTADPAARNSLKQTVGNRLNVCKKTFQDDITAKKAGMALEPVLIAELSGLLAILRKNQSHAT